MASVDIIHPTGPYFPEERKGWHGYIEWEDYPEKRVEAAQILESHSFAHVSLIKPAAVSCID